MLCLFYRQSRVLALSMNKISQQPKPADNVELAKNNRIIQNKDVQKTQQQIRVKI
jgi:hypothetical protein